jgi:hypothetical protein
MAQNSDSATTFAAQLLSYIANRERAKVLDSKRYTGVRQLLTFLDQHYNLPEGDETASLDTPGRTYGFPGAWVIDKSLIYAAVKTPRRDTTDVHSQPEYTRSSAPPAPAPTLAHLLLIVIEKHTAPAPPLLTVIEEQPVVNPQLAREAFQLWRPV